MSFSFNKYFSISSGNSWQKGTLCQSILPLPISVVLKYLYFPTLFDFVVQPYWGLVVTSPNLVSTQPFGNDFSILFFLSTSLRIYFGVSAFWHLPTSFSACAYYKRDAESSSA